MDKKNHSNVDLKVRGVCVDLLDELEPAIHRFDRLSWFQTEEGQLAITPQAGRLDDEIWVLHRYDKPVLLRPEGQDSYGFLVDVVIYDFAAMKYSEVMFGAAIDSANQEPVKELGTSGLYRKMTQRHKMLPWEELSEI
jgi:hypothetical protein